MNLRDTGDPMETLIDLALYAFFACCCSLICRKAGLNALWGVLVFIPLLNVIALYYIAFARWPRFQDSE
ncbi:MAG TPA: hypothetical protein VFT73_06510 [Sphingomonas sp.]|jgi:hypothetical protein|nr:hypothetical protein [Sphingomonas sp.]